MKKKMFALVIFLMLLAALALVSAQSGGGAHIGPYGNLVGLTDAQGKDVLSQIPRPWFTGYAIAYQVRSPKGIREGRFVYVSGDQTMEELKVVSEKCNNSRVVVRTLDNVLEISRGFIWDEKSKSLKLDMLVTNTSKAEIKVTAIELQYQSSFIKAALTGGPDTTRPIPIADLPLCRMSAAGCTECPPCPCGKRCLPGQARAFYREQDIKPLAGDPFGKVIESFKPKGEIFSLVWVSGARPDSFTLLTRKQIHLEVDLPLNSGRH